MPKIVPMNNIANRQAGVTTAIAFSTKQKRRYGDRLIVLAQGEQSSVPAGQRVEVLLEEHNQVFFTESEMTLTGPLVFWHEPAPTPSKKERFSMLDSDPDVVTDLLCTLTALLSAFLMILAIVMNDTHNSILALLGSGTFGFLSFVLFNVSVSPRPVQMTAPSPTKEMVESIPGVEMSDFYPSAEKA